MNLSNAPHPRDLAGSTELHGIRQGFAVAAADMAARIGLVDVINANVRWDAKQCKVSPGLRILALIIAMMVDPRALYRLEEFFGECDCAVLFGEERRAQDFNDDAIGHAERKQLVAGVVTRSDGVPLAVEVLDGNADDPTWLRETLVASIGDPRTISSSWPIPRPCPTRR